MLGTRTAPVCAEMLVHSALGRLYALIADIVSDAINTLHANLYTIEHGNTTLLEDLLDRHYLHSKFCQRHFNFRLNYHQYANGESSELHHAHPKCGIAYEEHTDIIRDSHAVAEMGTITGQKVDLCRLWLPALCAKHMHDRGVVVLVPGILQSSDVFICGGKESLAFHLLSAGYSVWLLNSPTEVSQSTQPVVTEAVHVDEQVLRAFQGRRTCSDATAYQHTSAGLIAVVRYIQLQQSIQQGTAHARGSSNNGVYWIAHSTACNDLLVALSGVNNDGDSVLHMYEGHENTGSSIVEVRQLTRSVVLLSPLVTLSHLHPHYRPNYAHNGGTNSPQRGIFPSLLLHELLLCQPQRTYELLGTVRLLTSLQLWRDLLQPATYTYLVSIICKYTLGWRNSNISPQRRCELLPHLFSPTSTGALVKLLYASTQNVRMSGGFVSVCGNNVRALVRWLLNCTCITLDVAIYIMRYILRGPTAGVVDSTKNETSMKRLVDTSYADHTEIISHLGKRSALSVGENKKLNVTVVVGDQDALYSRSEVAQRLHQIRQKCTFLEDVHVIAGYEHMDTLWADDARSVVFPIVIDSLAHPVS